jgi:hypothetical protein
MAGRLELASHSGEKDRQIRLTTENMDGPGKGKPIRILYSVYFRVFRG